MSLSRRNFLIKGIGSAIITGVTPSFLPGLLPYERVSMGCHVSYGFSTIGGRVVFHNLLPHVYAPLSRQ